LNGFDTTINGLAHGVTDPASVANTFVENDAPNTLSTLTVGDYDQTATFGGIIRDAGPVSGGGGTLAITKIGSGVQTLSGTSTYSGPTNINNGALAITGQLN